MGPLCALDRCEWDRCEWDRCECDRCEWDRREWDRCGSSEPDGPRQLGMGWEGSRELQLERGWARQPGIELQRLRQEWERLWRAVGA